jgi:hypothetical protein
MRLLKPRPVDDIVLGVVTLFSVALELILADTWWQTTLAVVGAALGIRWLRQGMRARKAEQRLPGRQAL